MKKNTLISYRKSGDSIVTTTTEPTTPKTTLTFNLSTRAGCHSQYSLDKDIEALRKNLAAVREAHPEEFNTGYVAPTKAGVTQPTDSADPGYADGKFRIVTQDPNAGHNYSKVAPAYIVEEGYYLLYDGGKCYFLRDTKSPDRLKSNGKTYRLPTIVIKLTDPNNSGVKTSYANTVIVNPRNTQFSQLSKAEYDNIVAEEPSIETLFSVYAQLDNAERLEMNLGIAQAVF